MTDATSADSVVGTTGSDAPKRRRRLTTTIRVVVSVAALGYLLRKAGLGPIAHRLAAANPGWLTLGFALGGLSALVTARQWHGLLRATGLPRTFRRCLRLEMAGRVFDAALPSSIGGDIMRAILVSDDPADRVPAAASVVLRRLCNFPGMVVLMAIGLLATLQLSYAGRIRPYAWVGIVGGTVAVALTFSPLLGRVARLKLLQWGPGRMLAKLLRALHDFRGQRRDLLVASFRGVVFWTTVVASQWCFMEAVGIHVPLTYAAVVVTTANALTMLPISLGGYGLREGAFSAFLAVGGMATTAQGVAVGVCLTVQTMALGILGIPFYLTLRRRAQQRKQLTNAVFADAPIVLDIDPATSSLTP